MLGSSSMGVFSSTAFCAERASLALGLADSLAAGLASGFAGAAGVWARTRAGVAAMNKVAKKAFMDYLRWISMTRGFEPALHFVRQLPTRAVCSLKHLPVVPVACPVLQLTFETDRCPFGKTRSRDNFGGGVDFVSTRRKRFQDRPDLVRVDAPHPRKTKLKGGPFGSGQKGRFVLIFRDHTVRRDLAMRMTG